jgi:hypothetical protein
MGLDVYVGSLTRYYRRDWETIIQQAGRETGMTVHMVYPNEPDTDDEILIEEETRAAVLEWRSSLANEITRYLSDGLSWSEEPGTPYFTDKPAWDGYGALLLWAAYTEHPEISRPSTVIEDWVEDSVLKASQAEDFSSQFPSLMGGVELWLPGQFKIIFKAFDVAGEEMVMGPIAQLQAELIQLNQMTWRASDEDIKEWRRVIDPYTKSFDEMARFGYSIFRELVGNAVEHKLPMKLDY